MDCVDKISNISEPEKKVNFFFHYKVLLEN